MLTKILQILQSLGIIGALLSIAWQIWRARQESERQRYLEVDKRYVDFMKESLDFDDPPLGYNQERLQHFLSSGGTKKELILYDLLFSTWESAYLLYQRKHKPQWKGWKNWIRAFFVGYPRSHLAWEITAQYFDTEFYDYVTKEIIEKLDMRAVLKFPITIDEWSGLPANYDENGLRIGDFQVMQTWEEPIMREMAYAVAKNHGDVLEVGYGLGIASNFIQENSVKSHTILEPHLGVFKRLQQWAYERSNVIAINDSWERYTKTLSDERFDSILFDTYPLRQSQLHKNHFEFFPEASRLLKRDGIFTYYSDEATNVCTEHQKMLLRYFSEFSVRIVQVTPPSNCQYWQASSMVVVIARK